MHLAGIPATRTYPLGGDALGSTAHEWPQLLLAAAGAYRVCACRGQGAQCDTDAEFDVDPSPETHAMLTVLKAGDLWV